jgi:hypothetical protein
VTRLSGTIRLLHPQLDAIVAQLEAAQHRFHQLEARTPEAMWGKRATPDSWSIGECIAHLNLTSKAYIPLLRFALEIDNRVHKPPKHYRRDPMGWLLYWTMGELPRFAGIRFGRVKTTSEFVPAATLVREMVVAEFNTFQHELVMLTHRAEQRDIEKLRIISPFSPRISYNVYSCLAMLPRHQNRHLAQAENVWSRT